MEYSAIIETTFCKTIKVRTCLGCFSPIQLIHTQYTHTYTHRSNGGEMPVKINIKARPYISVVPRSRFRQARWIWQHFLSTSYLPQVWWMNKTSFWEWLVMKLAIMRDTQPFTSSASSHHPIPNSWIMIPTIPIPIVPTIPISILIPISTSPSRHPHRPHHHSSIITIPISKFQVSNQHHSAILWSHPSPSPSRFLQ